MHKKLLIGLLAASMALTAVIGFTACGGDNGGDGEEQIKLVEGTEGLAYRLSDDVDGAYYIASGMGTCTATEIVIGNVYNGLPVTSISGFYDCSELKSVTISEGITSIEWWSFSNCGELTSVTIPNSVERISGFRGCDKLIQKEKGVSYIDRWAVDCDEDVTSVTLRSNTVALDGTFSGCSRLTKITIPKSVIRILGGSFSGCSGLTSLTIPSSVKSIGSGAFKDCSGLIQTENGIDYVDKWMVGCDRTLTSVTLRSDTVGIASQAFAGCDITTIIIPSGVKSIGAEAFQGCNELTSITIPASVKIIGDMALGYYGRKSVQFEGTKAQWNAIKKGYEWGEGLKNHFITVQCTDGELHAEGSEIE